MRVTGERFIPTIMDDEMITYEHWHRYYVANEFIKDKVVLDIACGTGYGTFFMSKSAKNCIGIDICPETIKYANKNYSKNNIEFKQGSIVEIPIEDKSIDVIVSFETIEHIDEQMQKNALKEYKRVLKDDGILFISSPNIDCWDYNPSNPFHLKEFSAKEFVDFLKNEFKYVNYAGQEVKASSSLYCNHNNPDKFYYDDYSNMGNAGNTTHPDKNNETYIIAVCSNNKAIELQNSVLIDSKNSFMKKLKEYKKNIEKTMTIKRKKILSFKIWKKRKIVIYKEYDV